MIRSSIDVPKGDAKRARHGDMDDLIWMEILCRLPTTKSVFRCRCVSKHWNSLISHQYFISNFINSHRDKYGSDTDEDQLLLFVHYYTKKEVMCATGFLSYQGVPQGRMFPEISYRVESSFNDLLVCSDYKSNPHVYYIFNPITKERVELPMYQPEGPPSCHIRHVGFICEPFCTRGQLGVNVNYRYRVVSIVNFDNFGGCSVETYSSETRRWSVQTSLKRRYYSCDSNVVGHNGKLYWYNRKGGVVVVYDPFVTKGEPCFYFYGLDITQSLGMIFRLIESQGSILLVNFVMKAPYKLSIWKLKENGNDDYGTWCFERSIIASDIISSCNASPGFLQYQSPLSYPLILGIHPSNSDVIFLTNYGSLHVASYNLVTKEWQVLGEVQQCYDIDVIHYIQLYVPATLPWWPTPVH